MLDFTNCNIEKVSVHQVGNITNGEELLLSEEQIDISEWQLQELLKTWFLSAFSDPEYFEFTSEVGDVNQNPVFRVATQIFAETQPFHTNSLVLAKYLYEISTHPAIKPGDLFVVHFTDVSLEGELMDAIGIFKSENKQNFLKLDTETERFSLEYDEGIFVEKLDKGCLILNMEKEEGYRVCIVDKTSKAAEAQYWKGDFLQLKPVSNDYYYTKQFMNVTKDFVTKQVPQEFEVAKPDQIDLLNRSAEYFKTNTAFDKETFESEILQDDHLIQSFQQFNHALQEEQAMPLSDHFTISPQAVKKQSRIFKSVLKLDKNFHIYIHGNRNLIEQGVDENGRKFYKVFYNHEE